MIEHTEENKAADKTMNRKIFIAIGVLLAIVFLFNALKPMLQRVNAEWDGILGFFKEQSNGSSGQNIVVKVVSEESQVIEVVKNSTPAVVSIIASAEVPKLEVCYREERSPFDDDFYGDFFSFRVPTYCEKGTEKKRVGAGTGFLVSSDGYILTNKHVVSNVDAEYTVVLNDPNNKDESFKARVLAKDPVNDIAVLKIEKEGLPFLVLGDSESLQVGQTAIAIGYALGVFDNTVSKGVISGLARSIIAAGSSFGRPEQLEGVIQTDAAINPGNSGGPLLDIAGNVIGMNVAMASAQSIGFAIPVNEVRKVYEDVKETGKVQRAFLGVRYMMIDKELQERNSLPVDYGALIIRGEERQDLSIVPGSPADIAGIVENDIILEINGKKIDKNNTLARAINMFKIGDKVTLKIYHRGEEKKVIVTLGERQ